MTTGTLSVKRHKLGFYQLDPLPAEEDLNRFYRDDFYQTHKPGYIDEEEEDARWHQMQYEDRCSIIRELREATKHEVRSILEIGCGTGRFLEYLHNTFRCSVTGIEPNRAAAAEAVKRGLRIETTPWQTLADYREKFDLVAAHFVLEHDPDPLGLLDFCWRNLSAGGLLYVAVPNDFSAAQMMAQIASWRERYWVHPDHCNYWNFTTLEATLYACGFKPLRRDTTFPMEGFLLSDQNYVSNPDLGRQCHRWRVAYELAWDAADRLSRRNAMREMANCGIGRDAIVYAVKDFKE